MAKLDRFIIDNTTYELVPEIAPLFNPATPYYVGDCVIHDAVLYKFTANHTGAWTGNDVAAFEVGSELVRLGSGASGSGLTEDVKVALLACFEKVAWIDEDGQDYYDALYSALYPPADLVSISAVYTQSGTVYDTDTLDSLKSNLVVTAFMDDSTTRTVTSYTLSGTLTEGTSTITVSYGGKTTTFTVTVTEYVRTLLHAWDFTNSLSDTVGSVTVSLSGASRDSSGIHFTAKTHRATMAGVLTSNITIEVDITEIDSTNTDKNLRLAMFNSANGFIYRKTDSKWEWYIGDSWRTPSPATSDKHIFDGKTLVMKIDSNSIPTVYCDGNTVANNGASVASYSDFILGSADYTPFNMVITAVRIYSGVD